MTQRVLVAILCCFLDTLTRAEQSADNSGIREAVTAVNDKRLAVKLNLLPV
jgi:hypothetical protein